MKATILLPVALALAACGSTGQLAPAPGRSLPVAPYGARATPTPQDLLAPTVQARPGRSDEVLVRSQERSGNEFDLPPN